MSKNLAIVGAPVEANGGGHAYIYNVKTGTLLEKLSSPNSQNSGFFWASVAISGTIAVVGAQCEAAAGLSGAGHAYINATTCSVITTLTSPNYDRGILRLFRVYLSQPHNRGCAIGKLIGGG